MLKKIRRKYLEKTIVPKYKRILEMLPEEAVIIDAGCGKGNLSKYILSKKPKLRIVGLDLNENCDFKHKNFIYFQSDLNKLLPSPVEADYVILADVLEHLENPGQVLGNFKKYSKNFIISIPNLNFWLFRMFPTLEDPPIIHTQHLHHWKPKEFIEEIIKKEGLQVEDYSYATDFPEFRWSNYFPLKNKEFFNQTIIMKAAKKEDVEEVELKLNKYYKTKGIIIK